MKLNKLYINLRLFQYDFNMSTKNQINTFFKKVKKNLENIDTNMVINNGENLTYIQAKEKITKILYHLKNIKREKIVIFSDKSFNYYHTYLIQIQTLILFHLYI